ncbi:MAG: hypothetical protein J6Y94_02110 [Bacteriovoracaceae bacterium]|nr:hypothetical protein [Bacteriovoracaceae bacterium]
MAQAPRPPRQNVYKRKEMMVNPRVQYTLMATFLLAMIILIAVCYITSLYLVESIREQVMTDGPSPILDQLKDNLVLILAVTAAILITGVGSWILIVSHRIAGPIFGLVKIMQEMAQGAPGRKVHFRRGDFFPELEQSFNQLYDRYQQLQATAGGNSTPPPPPGGTPPPPPPDATRNNIKGNHA